MCFADTASTATAESAIVSSPCCSVAVSPLTRALEHGARRSRGPQRRCIHARIVARAALIGQAHTITLRFASCILTYEERVSA
jgi:hypothetical protein